MHLKTPTEDGSSFHFYLVGLDFCVPLELCILDASVLIFYFKSVLENFMFDKNLAYIEKKKGGRGGGETCKGRIRFSKMQNDVTKK